MMSSGENKSGEVNLTPELSQNLSKLCMNPEYSDVTFIIKDVKLSAHKNILAARSPYFQALLSGGFAESTQREIELNVPLEAFKILLKYVYTGCVSLNKMSGECIMDLLGLTEQYSFETLKLAISKFLVENVSQQNCCSVLDAAAIYNLEALVDASLTFMDRNALEVLTSNGFNTLSQDSLCTLLERDSFFAPEIEIFNAVHEWCKSNPNANTETVISKVRLPIMDSEQLFKIVRPCPILNPDRLLDGLQEKMTLKNIRYRGALCPEKNVAATKYNSKTICGICPENLLNGDVKNYDGDNGYTWHRIPDSKDKHIVVELGTISIINYIKLLLWDQDLRWYSYFIETSVDKNSWNRVIDHTEYKCRSWQFLYFPSRPVRYIKLIGTHNSENAAFHVVALEAYYTANVPVLLSGHISPTHNVATVEKGAVVIEGENPDALLNGYFKGYTSHEIGNGAIIVQLGQPYYIGSLRLLLYDDDEITYSFYIETSVNQEDWETAVDERDRIIMAKPTYPQQFEFSPRSVIFFKIVGTHNPENNEFNCVYFESPAQKDSSRIEAQE